MSHLRLLNRIHATEIFFRKRKIRQKISQQTNHSRSESIILQYRWFRCGIRGQQTKIEIFVKTTYLLNCLFFVFVLFHHDDKECKLLKSIVYAQMRNYAKNRTDFIPSHGILHTQFFGKKGRCQSNEIMAPNF